MRRLHPLWTTLLAWRAPLALLFLGGCGTAAPPQTTAGGGVTDVGPDVGAADLPADGVEDGVEGGVGDGAADGGADGAAPDTSSDAAADTPTTPLFPVLPCKLPIVSAGAVGLGFPRSDVRLRSTGIVRARVLFVDFSDAPAQAPPQEVADILAPTAAKFFSEASYGAMDFRLDFHLKWLRMSGPSTNYAAAIKTYQGHRDWLQEAVTLADAEVDFADADVVVVMAVPTAKAIGYGPTWMGVGGAGGALVADGAAITNGVTSGADLLYWGGIWLNHELGHSLGLPDLYDFKGNGGFTRPFSIRDLISGSAPGYFGYSRWLVGWLADPQVACLPGAGEVKLSPIELPGGVKIAMVPRGPSRALVVESRRAIGLDKALTREGAVVYTVDTAIDTGSGPIQVHNSREALLVGESVTVDGVTVQVLKADGAGDSVKLTF